MPLDGVAREVGEGVHRDRQRAGPDCDMRLGDADDVEEKWGRQDRPAAAQKAEHEADDPA